MKQSTENVTDLDTVKITSETACLQTEELSAKKVASERVKEALPTNWTFLTIFACVIGYKILQTNTGSYDHDLWWLLATGREIVENGIPYVNPWPMFDTSFNIVVQQWLSAVVLYSTQATFGYLGLKFLVFVQCTVLTLVLFWVCRVISGERSGSGEVFGFIISIGIFSLSAYLSVRPHVYSMIFYALTIGILEKYRRTNNYMWLFALPLITCLHVNLHSAMAPFDLVIIALYVVPNIPELIAKLTKKKCSKIGFYMSDYNRVPVLIAFIGATSFMLLNPYSINGALYVWLSYGVANYGNYISEMKSTNFWSLYGGATMAMIVLGSIAVGKRGLRSIDLPLTCLFLGCVPLSMMHTRNVWIVAFFAIFLFVSAFRDVNVNWKRVARFTGKMLPHMLVIIVAVVVTTGCYYVQKWEENANNAESDASAVPSEAMNYLDRFVAQRGMEKTDLKIYNQFNNGGYLEWRGYRVFMDQRPELWEPAISGGFVNYYQSYVDAEGNYDSCSSTISTYNFDFCLVINDTNMADYLPKISSYKKVVSGLGYALYARSDLDAQVVDEDKSAQVTEDLTNVVFGANSLGNGGNNTAVS